MEEIVVEERDTGVGGSGEARAGHRGECRRCPYFQNNMVTLYVQKAKDHYSARELALLRASKPHPTMVSHLDEIDEAVIEEGIRKLEDPSSVPPDSAGMVFHRRTLGLHLHRRIHRVLRQTLGICAFFQHEPAVPRLRELCRDGFSTDGPLASTCTDGSTASSDGPSASALSFSVSFSSASSRPPCSSEDPAVRSSAESFDLRVDREEAGEAVVSVWKKCTCNK
ncbi:uncharacterized protein LOC114551751 [Perca flavescens]|uniref:uncharacterized protein LOC114551751 n=1 Tax=Perca flavescens TaxID=8167 RepID=UPI00106E6E79|nr:uncharacterized protein LOC114551751 [Perca flavescens]